MHWVVLTHEDLWEPETSTDNTEDEKGKLEQKQQAGVTEYTEVFHAAQTVKLRPMEEGLLGEYSTEVKHTVTQGFQLCANAFKG